MLDCGNSKTAAVAHRAIAAVFGLIIMTGCAGSNASDGPETSTASASGSESGRVVAVEPPPPSVPSATFLTAEIQPAQYTWRLDGVMTDVQPLSDEEVPINDVSIDPDRPLTFTLGTAVQPLAARMLVYRAVSTSGIPLREDAEEVDCFSGATCIVDEVGGPDPATSFVYNGASADVSFIILYVEYATNEPADRAENIVSYRAGWVVRIS